MIIDINQLCNIERLMTGTAIYNLLLLSLTREPSAMKTHLEGIYS